MIFFTFVSVLESDLSVLQGITNYFTHVPLSMHTFKVFQNLGILSTHIFLPILNFFHISFARLRSTNMYIFLKCDDRYVVGI